MREPSAAEAPAVLIVEDEFLIALDYSAVLAAAGFRVIGLAASGEEALAAAHECVPDVVLMDIQIAGAWDGIATARALKDRFAAAVVFLSAQSDPATLRNAQAIEPAAVLSKPALPAAVVRAVREALKTGRA